MPNVSAFLSGGVSVGILAGVVSGLFCLVVAGIRWAGKLKAEQEARHSRLQQECCQCSKPLPLLPAKRVSCDHCGRRACGTCSAAAPRDGRWLCSACSHEREVKLQSGEWFFRQVQRRFNTAALANSKHKSEDGEGMDPECVQVREFIERLVESLVAGGLDDVCVKRLHSHPEYDRMFACHHASLCEALARLAFTLQMAIANKPMPEQESPSAAHSALKQLIHQIIQEAMTLPTLQGFENRSLNRRASQEHGMSAEDMTSKTYEDILATAILNKVIERYQQTGGLGGTTLDGNSNLLNSSNMEQQPKFISRLEIGVKSPDSLEEANASNISFVDDCNMSEASITDPLSFTIEECIEEVTTYSQSDDEEEDDIDDDDEEEEVVLIEPALDSGLNFYRSSLDFIKGHRVPFPELGMDIIDGQPLTPSDEEKAEEPYLDDLSSPQPTDMISPVDSWEENWLFQRRRLKSSGVPPPMPVPMLVPNPSEEYRALIGDRDVEEYSDLSDCSDSVLEDLVLASVGDNSNHQDLPVPVRDEVNSLGDLQDTYRPVRAIPCITVDMLDEETEKQHDQDECNQEMQDFVDSGEINCKVQGSEHGDPMEEYSSMNEGLELAEAKNVELYNSSSVDCLSEFGQQDSEYTEDYATVTQRQMDSLSGASEPELPTSPVTRTSSPTVSSDYTMHPTSIEQSTNQSLTDEPQLDSNESQAVSELAMPPRPGIDQSDDENCTLPRTGTIAEREHKKWESATPLPNNPYSSENISKRLSRRTPYNRHSSSSDTSVEFPELKSETIVGGVIEKPLQIVCASDDLDYKRYGRDYYINSKAPSGERKTSLSSVVTTSSSSSNINSQQPQENSKSECEITALRSEPELITTVNEDKDDIENIKQQIPHLVESEVARWQREINQTEQQWIQKLQPNKPDIQKTNQDSEPPNDRLNYMKAMITNGKNEDKCRPPVVIKPNNIDKRQQVPQDDPKSDAVYGKSSFKQIKFPVHQEQNKSSEEKISERNGGSKYIINKDKVKSLLDESSIAFLNGSGRSDSPSEASVVSSDSEFSHNMPSVKELTKHFASIADSDSSSSTPKSPSPAPKWRPPERQPAVSTALPVLRPSLSPSRPVREVHSLTARSISREFREGLRRPQPSPLDRNVHSESGVEASSIILLSNGTSAEGYSTHSSTSDEMEAPPAISTKKLPPRSLSHNIAFWEQMQKNKS